MNPQEWRALQQLNGLVQEAYEGNLLGKPEVQTCLLALGINPGDQVARELLDLQLEPFRLEKIVSRNPFRPLPEQLDGDYRFAIRLDLTQGQVGLDRVLLGRGAVLIGGTGAGKSQLIYALIDSLLKDPNARVNFFTKKPSDAGLLKAFPGTFNWIPFGCPLNYLDPNGLPPSRIPSLFATLFGHACNFWFGGQAMLAGAIESLMKAKGVLSGGTDYPIIKDLLSYLHGFKPKERRLLDQIAGIREKLQELLRALGSGADYRRGLDLGAAEDKNKIIFIPTDIPPAIARFHVIYLHSWQFERRRLLSPAEIEQAPFIVNIFDDATSYFHIELERKGIREGNLPPLYDLMTMQRAYKLGSLVATHTPQLLARCVHDGRAITLCLSLPGGEALDFVANSLGGVRLTADQKQYIASMAPGNGVICTSSHPSPTPFYVPSQIEVRGTPAEAEETMKPFWLAHPPVVCKPQTALDDNNEDVLSEDAKRLLMLVASKPGLYSSQYYTELSWPLATGTRIRSALVDAGYLRVWRVRTGRPGGQPEILELQAKAFESLGIQKPSGNGRGSFEHAWFVQKIKQWLEKAYA